MPLAPTNLTLIGYTTSSITLGFSDPNSPDVLIRPYRRPDSGSEWINLATLNSGSVQYTFEGLNNNTFYDVGVSTYDGVDESEIVYLTAKTEATGTFEKVHAGLIMRDDFSLPSGSYVSESWSVVDSGTTNIGPEWAVTDNGFLRAGDWTASYAVVPRLAGILDSYAFQISGKHEHIDSIAYIFAFTTASTGNWWEDSAYFDLDWKGAPQKLVSSIWAPFSQYGLLSTEVSMSETIVTESLWHFKVDISLSTMSVWYIGFLASHSYAGDNWNPPEDPTDPKFGSVSFITGFTASLPAIVPSSANLSPEFPTFLFDEFLWMTANTIEFYGLPISHSVFVEESSSFFVSSSGDVTNSIDLLGQWVPYNGFTLTVVNSFGQSYLTLNNVYGGDGYIFSQYIEPTGSETLPSGSDTGSIPIFSSSLSSSLSAIEIYYAYATASVQRQGLFIGSNEFSPHISLEPISGSPIQLFDGDIWYSASVTPNGNLFIGQKSYSDDTIHIHRLLTSWDDETSISAVLARFATADAPTDLYVGANAFIAEYPFTTVNTTASEGALIKNETWGAGFYMPDSSTISILGDADFLIPSGSMVIETGSLIFHGNGAIFDISGSSVSASINGNSIMSVLTGSLDSSSVFPLDGTLYVNTASAAVSLRANDEFYNFGGAPPDLVDGGTY